LEEGYRTLPEEAADGVLLLPTGLLAQLLPTMPIKDLMKETRQLQMRWRDGISFPNNDYPQGKWKWQLMGVTRINAMLKVLKGTEGLSDAVAKHFEAQAKFLRHGLILKHIWSSKYCYPDRRY